MSQQKNQYSHSSSSSCSSISCSDKCQDCFFIKADNRSAFGTNIIPGSGKLLEFFQNDDSSHQNHDGASINVCGCDVLPKCPRVYPGSVCINNLCDFACYRDINFINGDLIINIINNQQACLVGGATGIPACLPIPPCGALNDAIDIFPNLLGINGHLVIDSTTLRKITGFDKLRYVAGSIIITNNANLICIPSFPSLLDVTARIQPNGLPQLPPGAVVPPTTAFCDLGAIVIANNCRLRKVVGFEALRQVKDGIFIYLNSCLTHICGFVHLYRTDKIIIVCNVNLYKIVGFCYIDTINITLEIAGNNTIGNKDLIINAFVSLETAGRVIITENNHLIAINLDALHIIQNELIVRANPHLLILSLAALKFVDSIYIEKNNLLGVLSFRCLVEVNNVLFINANNGLVTLDDFNALKRIGHLLQIAENLQLAHIYGFRHLKYIGSKCVGQTGISLPCPQSGCPPVIPIPICERCFTCPVPPQIAYLCPICPLTGAFVPSTTANVFLGLPIAPTGALVTLPDVFNADAAKCAYVLNPDFFCKICYPDTRCGAPQCSSLPNGFPYNGFLDASIIIYGNVRLQAINAFNALKHVEGSIYIIYNEVLASIIAFEQLAFVIDIWIRNNQCLQTIIGFEHLLGARDITILESLCLHKLDNLKSLEFAQHIAIEGANPHALVLPKTPILTTLGVYTYYNFC